MNPVAIIVVAFFSIIMGVKCLGIYLNAEAKEASVERYAAHQQAKDAQLRSDCAKGIGSTTYYKGVYCKG